MSLDIQPARFDRAPSGPAQRFVAGFRSRLARYWVIVGITAVLAAGISLVLPTWFRAEGTLLPPEENGQSSFGMLTGMIQTSALRSLGFSSTSTPSDVFAEILTSRRLSEAAIRKFGYEAIYKRKGMDRTVKEFKRHLDVKVNTSGLLSVSFEDRSAQRASDVTNFLINELDRFNVETYKTRGKRLRMFLEARVAEIQRELVASEEKLLAFERANKVLSSTESEKLSAMSDILVQKFNLETQRAFVSSYSSPQNTELQGIDRQLRALNSELRKLPEVKLEGARLTLDVEVHRRLMTLLTGQYEDARMQETRDTPTVTILDSASPPQLKSRPKRLLMVSGAVLAALLGCAAWTAFGVSRES